MSDKQTSSNNQSSSNNLSDKHSNLTHSDPTHSDPTHSTHSDPTHSPHSDIDDVLNSDSESGHKQSKSKNKSNTDAKEDPDSDEDFFNIDADIDTMNNQLAKQMEKTNRLNPKIDNSKGAPRKVIKIDADMFKTLIIEYLSLDDQIKSFKETIKDKTDEKKQYESQILELMCALKQDIILTDKGNLERSVKESRGPLTPELIKTALTEILKCSDTANTYTDAIVDKRPTKELVALKRKNLGDAKKPKVPKGPLVKTKSKGTYRKKKNNDNDNNNNLDV